MPTQQIGAQTYTIREFCKTPADIAKSLKRLADMGFGVVEIAAIGPIEPTELKKMLDDCGLACVTRHTNVKELTETDKVVEIYQALDCKFAPIGGFHSPEKDEWEQFCRDFNQLAATYDARGLKVGYHNHSHELAPFADDPAKIDPRECPMQVVVDQLKSPIWFELDTYWIAHGGGDPAAWIDKIAASGKGRLPVAHVKDMTITPDREQKMCEVGAGNLNWPSILDACKAAGVEYYVIERDHGDLDPFDSLQISLDNLRAMGLN